MNIVVDSNVLFSALLKDSSTRKIILSGKETFLFPEYILVEYEKHKQELIVKAPAIDALFVSLMQNMQIISTVDVLEYADEAMNLVKHIDPDDMLFVACVLAHPGSVLWSDDKQLKRLPLPVKNTQEMLAEYHKK